MNGGYTRLIAQMSDGSTTGCSTDAFSVRPALYALTSNVAAPTKAGTQFTITATPKNPSNTTITSATGAPTLDNTKAPVAGGNQTLLQQSWNTGASFGTFIYNDVGTFNLAANAVYDRQFGNAAGQAQDQTNGDCNPGSGSPYAPNTCYGYSGASCTNATPWGVDASGKYGCDIGSAALSNVGRFYPDHYETSLAMTQGCSANGFSYMGQPFSMTASPSGTIQVKALAAGQTYSTGPGLPSFSTGYTPISTVWFGAQNAASATDLIRCISSTQNTTANRCALTTLPTKAAPSSTWSAGIYTAPATTFYFDPPKDATTTADATWGPYDTLNVGITVSDSDGSTLTVPASPTFTLNSDTYRAINATAAKMRYGRMRIQNSAGSDQVPLLLPVFLEYWTGTRLGAQYARFGVHQSRGVAHPIRQQYCGIVLLRHGLYRRGDRRCRQPLRDARAGCGGQSTHAFVFVTDIHLRSTQRNAGRAEGERYHRPVHRSAHLAQDRPHQYERHEPFRDGPLRDVQQPVYLPAGELLTNSTSRS